MIFFFFEKWYVTTFLQQILNNIVIIELKK